MQKNPLPTKDEIWSLCILMQPTELNACMQHYASLFGHIKASFEQDVQPFDAARHQSMSEMKSWLQAQTESFQQAFYIFIKTKLAEAKAAQEAALAKLILQQAQQRKETPAQPSTSASNKSNDNDDDEDMNDKEEEEGEDEEQDQDDDEDDGKSLDSTNTNGSTNQQPAEDNPENYIILDYYLFSQGEHQDIVCICSKDLKLQIGNQAMYETVAKNLRTSSRVRIHAYKQELQEQLNISGAMAFSVWADLKLLLKKKGYTPLLGKQRGILKV